MGNTHTSPHSAAGPASTPAKRNQPQLKPAHPASRIQHMTEDQQGVPADALRGDVGPRAKPLPDLKTNSARLYPKVGHSQKYHWFARCINGGRASTFFRVRNPQAFPRMSLGVLPMTSGAPRPVPSTVQRARQSSWWTSATHTHTLTHALHMDITTRALCVSMQLRMRTATTY